eukprot:10139446-Lingulodinium_polyedra.AAC.1
MSSGPSKGPASGLGGKSSACWPGQGSSWAGSTTRPPATCCTIARSSRAAESRPGRTSRGLPASWAPKKSRKWPARSCASVTGRPCPVAPRRSPTRPGGPSRTRRS